MSNTEVSSDSELSQVSKPLEIQSSDGQIVLRQYTPEDADEVFALIDQNRGYLSQFGDDTSDKYPTLESFRESILSPKKPSRLRFGIRSKDGVIVGSINLTPDDDNPKRAEIGYWLGKESEG